MADESLLLRGHQFDGKGGGAAVALKDVGAKLKQKKVLWLHLYADHPDARAWIEANLPIDDPLVIDALLAGETRPRYAEFDDGQLIILRGVNLNENAEPEDMVSLRVYVQGNLIISARRRKLQAVVDIGKRLEEGKGPRDASGFVTQLVTRLTDRMEPVLFSLNELVDDLEERLLDKQDMGIRHEIVDSRRQAILLRRYISPQRDVIAKLRLDDVELLDEAHQRGMQEQYDRITRYLEDLDSVRERSQIIQDELTNMLADKMNKNMYVLSVIAAIFLPLGFLTGLLGINVGGIPLAESDDGFAITMAALAALTLLEVIIFKKLKWF